MMDLQDSTPIEFLSVMLVKINPKNVSEPLTNFIQLLPISLITVLLV